MYIRHCISTCMHVLMYIAWCVQVKKVQEDRDVLFQENEDQARK